MPAIVELTIDRSRARITFDDERTLILRARDVKSLALAVGQEHDFERLRSRVCRAQLDDAYEAALCRLDSAARSEREMRVSLSRKCFLPEVIDAVIERLAAARLLNDSELAERLVSSMEASGKGKFAVMRKLRQRGIGSEASELALDSLSEEKQDESCLATARKLCKKYASLEAREARNKLFQALSRRGFSWDSIAYALERLSFSEDE